MPFAGRPSATGPYIFGFGALGLAQQASEVLWEDYKVSRKESLREQRERQDGGKVELTGEFLRPATREEEKKMDRKWWELFKRHG